MRFQVAQIDKNELVSFLLSENLPVSLAALLPWTVDLIRSALVTVPIFLSPSDRIWPRGPQHKWREGILHGLRHPGHPAHLGHVPERG